MKVYFRMPQNIVIRYQMDENSDLNSTYKHAGFEVLTPVNVKSSIQRRAVGWLSTDYTAFYPGRTLQYLSTFNRSNDKISLINQVGIANILNVAMIWCGYISHATTTLNQLQHFFLQLTTIVQVLTEDWASFKMD
jgi:hypothetical protein